jgi:hypothetical protein
MKPAKYSYAVGVSGFPVRGRIGTGLEIQGDGLMKSNSSKNEMRFL